MEETFARSFDGNKAHVGLLQLQVDLQTIARVTKIHLEGENWSKTHMLKRLITNIFLQKNIKTSFFINISQSILERRIRGAPKVYSELYNP